MTATELSALRKQARIIKTELKSLELTASMLANMVGSNRSSGLVESARLLVEEAWRIRSSELGELEFEISNK